MMRLVCWTAALILFVSAARADVIEKTYVIPKPQVRPVRLAVDATGLETLFEGVTIPGLPLNAPSGSPVIPMLRMARSSFPSLSKSPFRT